MDGPRFDAFARSFATRLTRRAAFRRGGAAAAATVLAATGLGEAALAQATPPGATAATSRYAVIRRYTLASGVSLTTLVTQLRDGYVPQLRNFPGFLGYRVVDTGNGGLPTITAFQTSAQEAAAATQLATWVQQHLAGLLPAPSQVESGAVLINSEVCPAPVTPTATATSVAPTTTPCTGAGCACTTGTQNPCGSGLSCCAAPGAAPGAPGVCKASCGAPTAPPTQGPCTGQG